MDLDSVHLSPWQEDRVKKEAEHAAALAAAEGIVCGKTLHALNHYI